MLYCFLFEATMATHHPPRILDHQLRDTSAAVLGVEAREGPNTQDRDQHLIVLYCHLFEEMMATYHSLGIAGKVAGKSSNTQWAFRNLWKK